MKSDVQENNRKSTSAVADPGFSPGAPTPKSAIIFQFFAKNCMKMKEFGPPGGGARPWRPLGSANDQVSIIETHYYLSVCNVHHKLASSTEQRNFFIIDPILPLYIKIYKKSTILIFVICGVIDFTMIIGNTTK